MPMRRNEKEIERRIEKLETDLYETREYLIETRRILIDHMQSDRLIGGE